MQTTRNEVTGGVRRFFADLRQSFRWAAAMRDRCARWQASGEQVDGETLRRAAREVRA